MNRTILIIVVIGAVVVALIFAFNQTATDDVFVQPEVTEVPTEPEPAPTEPLTPPATDTPAPGGTEAPATGNPGAPQQ